MNIENIPTPITDREEFPIFTPGSDSTEITAVESAVARRLERENVKLRSELEEMTARAVSLAMRLPQETIAGDVQKWRDEAKAMLSSLPNTAYQPTPGENQ